MEQKNGYTASGKCVAPSICKADATSDGKGPDQGLSKLGELLGKLMEALKGGGDKGGGGAPPPTDPSLQNPNSTICTTMQPTSDASLVASNANCYYMSQTTDYAATSTDPSGGLVATPNSGVAPLAVTFAFTNGTSGCNTPVLVVDFGDGANEQAPTHSGTACTSVQDQTTHTFSTAGTYAIRLKNAQTGEVRGGVNLVVSDAPASTDNPQPNNTGTDNNNNSECTGSTCAVTNTTGGFTTGGNTSGDTFTTPLSNLNETGNIFGGSLGKGNGNGSLTGGSVSISTDGSTGSSVGGDNGADKGAALNFNTPQSIVQSIIAKNLPPGAYGDVKILANGTTIIAGVREGNSEVAGFFGSNNANGGTSAVSRMCTSRPWATNFLSFVIPPSFFDSLCTWRGYSVGKPATTATGATAPVKTTTQTFNTTGTTKATAQPATTTAPKATAKVDIWASPATVPLGARTSIFWSSEGVTECIETSPDGSFAQSSLKGGASTVPLTAPTVFTISCLVPGGAHVTDTVTVQIAI